MAPSWSGMTSVPKSDRESKPALPCTDFLSARYTTYCASPWNEEGTSKGVGATRGRTNRVMWKKGHIQVCVYRLFLDSPGVARNCRVWCKGQSPRVTLVLNRTRTRERLDGGTAVNLCWGSVNCSCRTRGRTKTAILGQRHDGAWPCVSGRGFPHVAGADTTTPA